MNTLKSLFIGITLISVALNGYASSKLPLGKPESVGMSSERLNRIDPILQQHVDNGDFSGAISLVARHGKIVHFKSFGQRDC